RLFVVDPRRTASARWADRWLGLEVGTDIALANAMAREIIHDGIANTAFIERATTGYPAYRDCVEPYTLEYAERVTGVPAEAIREAAQAYARADRAMICWTLGITEHHTSVDNVLALINLALLTGHVGRYGSGLTPLRGQNTVQGGGDMGAIPNRLPGIQDVPDTDVRAKADAKQGAARRELGIRGRIAARLGHDWRNPGAEQVWDEVRSLAPIFAGMSYRRLEEHGGLQWPCYDEQHPGELFLHSRLWHEPRLGPPAPFSVVEHRPPVEGPDDEFPFVLTTGRPLDSYNTDL